MKARKPKQPELKVSEDLEPLKGHQVSEMQLVYASVLAVVIFGFVAFVFSDGLLAALKPLRHAFPVYAVIFGFLMAFMQLNHLLADQLSDYIAMLQSHQSEVGDYLRQQMGFWRQLFSLSLEVNLPPAISRFGRLSETFQFTQIPVLHTPIQFRS